MDTPVITINQLTRRFNETVAVNNLSLKVRAGEIFGFLGHNGAGKTTTIKLLFGLARPTGSSAHVFGQDIQRQSVSIRKRFCRFLNLNNRIEI